MKNQDFERYFKTFMNRTSQKEQLFENLTKEEKIDYLSSVMNINAADEVVTITKEVEICKLSKDVRFSEIQKASLRGNMELVQKLAMGEGLINIDVITSFEKATQTAQLDHLTKIHIDRVGSLPDTVTIDVLGGDNFRAFIDFCYNEIHK